VAMLNEGKLVLLDDIETVLEDYGRFQCIFDVDRIPSEVAQKLQDQYGFLTVEDSTIRANRRKFDDEIKEILHELLNHQIEINGMRFEETELEDIFLNKVTSG
ncbi:MAG: hypothetical protein ABEJ65_09540, partial [bacterium]